MDDLYHKTSVIIFGMNYTNASDDMTPAYNFIQTAFFFAHVLLITFFPHLYFPVVSFVKCIYPVCYASTSRERERANAVHACSSAAQRIHMGNGLAVSLLCCGGAVDSKTFFVLCR